MLTDPFLPGQCSPITTLRRAEEVSFFIFYIFYTCCV